MSLAPFTNALTDILFNQAKEFVGIYDVTLGWFVRVNQAGIGLLGYPSEQAFLAEPSRTLRTEPLSDEGWASLQKEVIQNGHYEVEAEINRQNGLAFWGLIELTYFSLEDRPFFLVRLTEQSRLQQAERELAQSVNRFEAVVANATIGIIVCDRQGQIISANHTLNQLFGYKHDELLGQPIEVLVPRSVSSRHEQLRHSFNANPSVRAMGAHSGDLLARRQDGTEFPVEVSLSYFHLDEELYVVSYIVDITFKKNAERELIAQRQRVERLNAELEQKVVDRTHALMTTLEQLEQRTQELTKALAAEQELGELKSRFVSMASHEFRTPLTAVLTSATLIEKYPGSDQQDKRLKHLQRIRASVMHLNDILEEFLSVGRIEEGKIEAKPMRLTIDALLSDTIADVQGLLKARQTIDKEAFCSKPVWLDPSLLRKILVNLLSNAIKYSGEGSVVTVRARCTDQLLTLTVQDQGVGISREDQEHLFERFFRARNVTNIPGTGLGLYIIGRYLELMNGTISLQSELNVGTTVTITIPYENHSAD
ncbi:PAS domain-containing sensor histidine kinase [Hymenobacter sp. GOD-10R]|uniref:sensor histidine kinase n=1 Tax=Hymenobacter sp. GOD-10R TaxID=3093922 RepID=UPI002D79C882|nr:PAS domain-containing sensor histidine kinase [Hymenobacter sp. GOD-10R]WRQ27728.1 PAS domain-containing sensor histidine kinase [Hymenobacter sp. GOD-10R]